MFFDNNNNKFCTHCGNNNCGFGDAGECDFLLDQRRAAAALSETLADWYVWSNFNDEHEDETMFMSGVVAKGK